MNRVDKKSEPFLVVGLGNPGRQYKNTRHNAGFLVVDRLSERLGVQFSRLQFRALVVDGRYQDRKIILAKPQTYMNESGQAVGSLVRFYKITQDNIVVVHDDVDLPFGALRLRPAGGSGGQKGMGSIIERLGTQEFPRLRVGIGRPPGQMLAAAYVLQEFDRDEKQELPGVIDRAVDALLSVVTNGLEKAMNQYNAKL
ncbi:MAG: aminoacyl-tRNA hydrolase [Chloroflexi bacterium]|nr:MAG: aminoacyl-tRNA hydrolase [Chloroflexota bacterium]